MKNNGNGAKHDVDAILSRIREEARRIDEEALFRGESEPHWLPLGAADSTGKKKFAPLPRLATAAADLEEKPRYCIADFVGFEGPQFIRCAYRRILGREPDPFGREHFEQAIGSGRLSKVEALGRIRYSPEGRARGVRITGLVPAYLLRLLFRIPIVGSLVETAYCVVRLPRLYREVDAMRQGHAEREARLIEQLNDVLSRLER
jgi:hypothetical protein